MDDSRLPFAIWWRIDLASNLPPCWTGPHPPTSSHPLKRFCLGFNVQTAKPLAVEGCGCRADLPPSMRSLATSQVWKHCANHCLACGTALCRMCLCYVHVLRTLVAIPIRGLLRYSRSPGDATFAKLPSPVSTPLAYRGHNGTFVSIAPILAGYESRAIGRLKFGSLLLLRRRAGLPQRPRSPPRNVCTPAVCVDIFGQGSALFH